MKRYPGIHSFVKEQSHLFNGRNKEIKDLYQLIVLNKLVVLFAKSGIGKTSLLQAGVCPKLPEEENLQPVFIRLNNTEEALVKQVWQKLIEEEYIPEDTPDNLSLWEYLKLFWYADAGEALKPVLVFDQFEELFTLYTPEKRKEFVKQFADLCNSRMPEQLQEQLQADIKNNPNLSLENLSERERSPDVKIVLSIRSDYLYLLDELSDRIPAIMRCRYQLLPLNEENARKAINNPAEKEGSFDSPNFEFSEAALNNITAVLSEERSGTKGQQKEIEAFQLQLLCAAIEQKMLDDKKEAGFEIKPAYYGGKEGIQTILHEFYEGILEEIDPKQKNKVQKLIEENLIRNERRIMMEESVIIEEFRMNKELLKLLTDKRLLRKEPKRGTFYYEVSHDTLIKPIHTTYKERKEKEDEAAAKAERLAREKELEEQKKQLEQERKRKTELQNALKEAEKQKALALQKQKEAEANEARAQKQKRRANLFGILGAILFALAIGFGIFAFIKNDAADKAQKDADTQKNIADTKTEQAKKDSTNAKKMELLAEEKTKKAKLDSINAAKQKKAAEIATETAEKEKKKAGEAIQEAAEANEEVKEKKEIAAALLLEAIDKKILELNYKEAENLTKEAAELKVLPDSINRRFMELAFWHTETGNRHKARELLKQALSLKDNVEAQNFLKEAVYTDKARKNLNAAIKALNPKHYEYLQKRYYPEMIAIKGGEFEMGTDTVMEKQFWKIENWKKSWGTGELPVHTVQLDDFKMAKTEVTVFQFALYCKGSYTKDSLKIEKFLVSSWGKEGIGNNPVVMVNWYQAVAYCNWSSEQLGLEPAYIIDKINKDPDNKNNDDWKWTVSINKEGTGLRLPTEAQWEYAAKGGQNKNNYIFAGGNVLKEVAWYDANSSRTHPVGQKKPNALGLYDMSGNVWEWCQDWYDGDFYKNSPKENPTALETGFIRRVLRGGSWTDDAESCRSAFRSRDHPLSRYDEYGVRPACLQFRDGR